MRNLDSNRIDQHNQLLFEQVRSLENALSSCSDIHQLKSKFLDALDYLVFHFACEEIWMDRTPYGAINEHKSEHVRLRQALFDIHAYFLSGETSPPVMMLQSVIAAIDKHLDSDDLYSTYVKSSTDAMA